MIRSMELAETCNVSELSAQKRKEARVGGPGIRGAVQGISLHISDGKLGELLQALRTCLWQRHAGERNKCMGV
jgi:hypothetical protein